MKESEGIETVSFPCLIPFNPRQIGTHDLAKDRLAVPGDIDDVVKVFDVKINPIGLEFLGRQWMFHAHLFTEVINR